MDLVTAMLQICQQLNISLSWLIAQHLEFETERKTTPKTEWIVE